MTTTSPRPGLPMPAARYAAQRGETLTYSEALLDAREATPFVDADTLDHLRTTTTNIHVADLVEEVERLRAVEADRIILLERLAFEEAQRYDTDLKYPLRRIDENCYIPWSGGSDGPVAYGTLTRAEALSQGWLPMHLDRADERAVKDGQVLYNRAGPGEKCLTIDALKEAYADGDAYRTFRLTPDKVQPLTTQDMRQNEAGEWEHSETYWTPWAPDEVPDTLPKGWRDRF